MNCTAETYSNINPAVFCGGAAVADYYGADNDNYVAGEGFCCGDNNLKTKSIADDSLNYEKLQYYYHPDHLGSASYITNLDGEVVQHIEYVPFGEVFLEERNNIWNTPFLFNGKELDEETGLYYYGARYYNPRISLWYGVDPLAEKYPNISPFAYCANNPIKYVDPDGEAINLVAAAIGAAAGALIGGAIEAGTQLYKHGEINDWNAVGGSALQGGVTGGAAGLTGGASLAVTAGVAGTASVVGGTANRAVQGEDTTVGDVVMDASLGALFGAGGKYIGGLFSKAQVDKWAKIGSTGVVGENALKKLGGESQIYLKTSLGGRYVDQLVKGVAHESKVGYTSLTKSIQTQIAKDAKLMAKDEIEGAVWHFFKSPKTGQVGASKPLLDELKKNGINYIIHE